MATNSHWTVIFEDKSIRNQSIGISYEINDNAFWSDAKWSNIWAIQYVDDNHDYNDSVEYRDDTSHATWNNSGLGDFRAQFVSKWDAAHLAQLQSDWDADVIITHNEDGSVNTTESEADQIARKGARPSSYSSY
jgi:hypothetical protein|tara:strand:+ start:604 stop:1005 length:402 start_codon:yes stop_codon:yes gene_type:complete